VAAQEDFYVQIGLLIRRARVKAGLTQQELADAIAISRTSLTNIETGHQRLLVHVLVEIADSLGVKPIQLLPPLSVASSRPKASSPPPVVRAKKERDFFTSVLTRSRKRKT
jgi:transcriptional regulator with XRE-family HTH domain